VDHEIKHPDPLILWDATETRIVFFAWFRRSRNWTGAMGMVFDHFFICAEPGADSRSSSIAADCL
jgi:hypothetical protein